VGGQDQVRTLALSGPLALCLWSRVCSCWDGGCRQLEILQIAIFWVVVI